MGYGKVRIRDRLMSSAASVLVATAGTMIALPSQAMAQAAPTADAAPSADVAPAEAPAT